MTRENSLTPSAHVAVGRPRGEVRQAVEAWASTWRPDAGRPGLACHEIAAELSGFSAQSPGDVQAIRATVKYMCTAGTLRRAGRARKAGACRPVVLYAPVDQSDQVAVTLQALGAAWFGAGRVPPVPESSG